MESNAGAVEAPAGATTGWVRLGCVGLEEAVHVVVCFHWSAKLLNDRDIWANRSHPNIDVASDNLVWKGRKNSNLCPHRQPQLESPPLETR